LAQIAVNDAAAAGYAIYQVDLATGQRELKLAWGTPVPESSGCGFVADSYALQPGETVTGVLTFVFRGSAIAPATRAMLQKIARAIEAVWRLTLLPSDYARHAARIGEMETELADSKIAERARGMLANGAPPPDALDTIVRHVETVLRPGQLQTVIEQVGQQVEQEIAQRELAKRAKALLQTRYGMSEEQAHVHLRLVSRKSRKRLQDVARDLLEEPRV
jgi:hypothetical protein